jgi:hypothetical protein
MKKNAPTKKDLINVLKFIAVVPQAYYSRGPEWQVREILRVAREALTALEKGN